MVIPRSPRPLGAKTGSWRRYIRVSNRKLQTEGPTLPIAEKEVKFNEASNTTQEVVVPDALQLESRWYQKCDYESFDKDRQLTALQYRTITKKGRPFIEREYTVRGLEELCNEDVVPVRSDHCKRVLAEQTRQGDYPNPTMLREISCKSSREARQRSAQLGEADALAGHVSSSRSLQRKANGVLHNMTRKLQP